ncbi:MAG: alpha-L-fucosidase [Kiritimatiellaeota bacterium]|nr:alpha-L-fucosidase [Kiritimatiellota bacterium]
MTTAETKYLASTEKTRTERLEWFKEARFGMFVHFGLYSQVGRNEWVMNLERIPKAEYEKLAGTWQVTKGSTRAWAKLARAAGCKYIVMTTKHHEGFCLWNTKQTHYNAVEKGPKWDIVKEFTESARAEGLKVGLYYSLMDWHHPDGIVCKDDEAARQRFTAFTKGCVRELLTQYGKIDILWYDVSWPLASPQAWTSYDINAMARKLQPHIIINDRSQIPEDFGTPEEHITAADGDRAWEACMTFNGSWGWQQTPPEDWHSARKVVDMLRVCTAGGGNLLLNIGPHPDGSVPQEATERLTKVGAWVKRYGEAMYGKVERVNGITSAMGSWTRKNGKQYYWCSRWPGKELALGAIHTKLRGARLYPDGKELPFTQVDDRLVIRGLPEQCPDKSVGVGMIELTFAGVPVQFFNGGPVWPDVLPVNVVGPNFTPAVTTWRLSDLAKKPSGGIAEASHTAMKEGWRSMSSVEGFIAAARGFMCVHETFGATDGMVYFGTTANVPCDGTWRLHLGHDGGMKLFVDGKDLLTVPKTLNPCLPGRSHADVALSKGKHEIVVAFDLAAGQGWGIFLHVEALGKQRRTTTRKAVFPTFTV